MFKTRLISGIILLAAVILLVCLGGIPLLIGLAFLSVIGIQEFYRATGVIEGSIRSAGALPLTALICAVAYYAVLYFDIPGLYAVLPALMLLAVMSVYVFSYPRYDVTKVVFTFFPLIYVAVMLSFIYLTRNMDGGNIAVWLIFLSSFGCDTCAYCVGMLIGKHKMAPVLSPKKSIEGAVGGVAGAVLLGLLFAYIFKQPPVKYGVICGAGALISMVGDLAASAVKRNVEIKDYGTLIPGHGGVLDRFDSVIFTAPVVYFLMCLLTRF